MEIQLLFMMFSEMSLLAYLQNQVQRISFSNVLASYIQQLVENGEAAIGPPGAPIEHLAGQKNLCAMRFKLGISNLRVFFVYKDGLIYLLSSFYERQGHKNTEYSTHTPIAKTRFAELMEGE